jgi:hypothetical protein
MIVDKVTSLNMLLPIAHDRGKLIKYHHDRLTMKELNQMNLLIIIDD